MALPSPHFSRRWLSSTLRDRDRRSPAGVGLVDGRELGAADRIDGALDGLRDAGAVVHAYRGERDAAFQWLEKAVAQHDLGLGHKFRDEPKLAPLRDDPRYKDLLRKMNWPG